MRPYLTTQCCKKKHKPQVKCEMIVYKITVCKMTVCKMIVFKTI